MKWHDLTQGEFEWMDARAGIPTSSNFNRILTPKTRKLSNQAERYLFECVSERLLGHALEFGGADGMGFVERGKMLEKEAIPAYEFLTDLTVKRDGFGFCTTDDGRAGCSPDGVIGDDGLLEVKCRAFHVHLSLLLSDSLPADMTQIQGALWVCEREWCDVFGYCPGLPPIRIRVFRDEAYIRDLSKAVGQFCDGVDKTLIRLEEIGPGGRREDRYSGSSLTDEEMEVFEELRRGEPKDLQDELVQKVVNGDYADVRRWLRSQATAVAP